LISLDSVDVGIDIVPHVKEVVVPKLLAIGRMTDRGLTVSSTSLVHEPDWESLLDNIKWEGPAILLQTLHPARSIPSVTMVDYHGRVWHLFVEGKRDYKGCYCVAIVRGHLDGLPLELSFVTPHCTSEALILQKLIPRLSFY